jgi:hypothetical protein
MSPIGPFAAAQQWSRFQGEPDIWNPRPITPLLTHLCHPRPALAVTHNTPANWRFGSLRPVKRLVMRWREFIKALGGAAAWPLASRAQQAGHKRVGAQIGLSEDDPAVI